MFGEGGGWGITMPLYTLGVTLGGIVKRSEWIDGRLEAREYLCVTLSFDHDIVDGGPATRFAQHFKELLERVATASWADLHSGPKLHLPQTW